MRPKLTQSDLKALYAQSGNVCAYPGCSVPIVESLKDDAKPIVSGEAAHIIAFSPRGPRGSKGLSKQEINSASNFVLLCERHHKLIDARPSEYTADILQAMKEAHARDVQSRLGQRPESSPPRLVQETVPSSLIKFDQMPTRIYAAPARAGYGSESEIAHNLEYRLLGTSLSSFMLANGIVYSLNELNLRNSPYKNVVDGAAQEVHLVRDLLEDPEWEKRYTRMLNLALGKFLRQYNISFDKEHQRYFFTTSEGRQREFQYRTTTGRRGARSVVWNPVTKATGEGKRFWWHMAAGFRFDQFGPDFWCLSIRPERHLTADGYRPLPSKTIGRKVTSLKARLYNDKYLDELVFWRDILSQGRPEILFPFGSQACVGRAQLLEVVADWPAIGDAERSYVSQPHEHDLFTLAEFDEAIAGAGDE